MAPINGGLGLGVLVGHLRETYLSYSMQQKKFWAFISYSHHDIHWAKRLHEGIETYTVPKSLRGAEGGSGSRLPRKVFPIFRDKEEFAGSGSLRASIRAGLENSRCMVVICSPHSAASPWVNEEIRQFRKSGGSKRIYCLIVGGAGGPLQSLPPALLDGLDGEDSAEPLPVDARPGHDPWPLAKLKIIASILEIDFGGLSQRDKRRLHRRIGSVSLSTLLILLGLGTYMWISESRVEAEKRDKAVRIKAQQTDFQAKRLRAEARQAIFKKQYKTGAQKLLKARSLEGNSQPLNLMLGWCLSNGKPGFGIPGSNLEIMARLVEGAAFSQDGNFLALQLEDGSSQVFETKSGSWVSTLSFPKREGDAAALIKTLAFTPDPGNLLTGAMFAQACLWDRKKGRIIREFPAPLDDTRLIIGETILTALSVESNRFVTASRMGGGASLWDATSYRKVSEYPVTRIETTHLQFDADGSRWAMVRDGGGAEIHAADDGRALGKLALGNFLEFAFIPKKERLVVLYDTGLAVMDLANLRKEFFIPNPPALGQDVAMGYNDVEVSPGGEFIALAAGDGTVKIWNYPIGSNEAAFSLEPEIAMEEIPTGPLGPPLDEEAIRQGPKVVWGMSRVAFLHGGAFVMGLHTAGKGCVWEAKSGDLLFCFDSPSTRNLGLGIDPSGAHLVAWDQDEFAAAEPVVYRLPMESRNSDEIEGIVDSLENNHQLPR